ncbi:N-acetyltransferase [Brevundimonas variabilis]|uniref:Uncharacterized protein n=1 Tax=Brevundimonas variabilis TaxID=74312 RepID=A0A7W9CJ78_9CAUL|nr:N-acetyltransferase [Brevundimonas variabilis]MBB5746664.1 hypothetical protein [Brevundimonas variabilis]
MIIRPVRTSDHAGVNRLHRDVWWPERSAAGWRWLETNPARADLDAPCGWVVEDPDGEVAAFLGNFVQRFWNGDRLMHASTGFSTIVRPDVLGASRALFRAHARQPGLAAHYTFNANRRSSPLYRLFGLKPWPDATHALKLSWIVDPVAIVGGRLLREMVMRVPDRINYRAEWFMGPRLHMASPLKLPVQILRLTDFGDGSPYARFWTALKSEGQVLADRSPEIMRWRMADPDQTLRPIVLARVTGDRITGYAMAQMSKGSSIEPPLLDVIDATALSEAGAAIPELIATLIENARQMGAAKVRMQMVSPRMLTLLGPLAGRARREGGWGHAHVRFNDPTMADLWSPTPFDGDYAICLRPVPEIQGLLRPRVSPAFAKEKASI